MDIAGQIASLHRHVDRDLNVLSDFCLHTETFWQTFEVWVKNGNSLTVDNAETGSKVNESDLLALQHQYRSEYLLKFSFQHLTSLFESFLFDLIRIILVNNPIQLSQEKQFRVRDALALPDRDGLIHFFADQEIAERAYRRPREWFEYLNRLVKLNCPTSDEIEQFSEMKACRDVLTHNAGTVNAVYIDKAGPTTRWKAGDQIVIEPPYFGDCWRLIKKLVADLTTAAESRLGGA